MNKTWQLHKSGHYFNITINGVNANEIDAEIQIDDDKTVEIDEIQGDLIKFKSYIFAAFIPDACVGDESRINKVKRIFFFTAPKKEGFFFV